MKRLFFFVLVVGLISTMGCGVGVSNSGPTGSSLSGSPEPSKVAFTSDSNDQGLMELYYMNLDGTGQTKVPLPQGYAGLIWDPVISPDGTRIIFAYYGPDFSDLYSINVDGSNLKPLTSGADSWAPHFSPDATQIVFTRFTSGNVPHIWVMNSDGSGSLTDITSASTFKYDTAQFSPDGTQIIASRNATPIGTSAQRSIATVTPRVAKPAPQSIVTMNLDGSNEVVLSTESDENSAAQLSPDGSNLIFAARLTQNAVVSERVADHTRLVLTPTDSNNYDPVVVGSHVYFVSDRDGKSAIYRINVDGTGEVRLTDPAHDSTLGIAVH